MISPMVEKIKEYWRHFRESEPGNRFQDRYHRRQQSGGGRFNHRRFSNIALGVGIMLAGLAMVVAPGPGWITFFLGLGILAGEFLRIARFMDRAEMKLRRLGRRTMSVWASSPPARKFLTVLAASLIFIAALGSGGYYLLSRGVL